jgi:parvulin-like peptidyl-prolyl isomerase
MAHAFLEKVKGLKWRASFSQVWFTLGLLVMAVFVLSLLFFYLAPRENQLVRGITSIMPYPIVMVGGGSITERSLAQNMSSVRRFYENQDFTGMGLRVDFTTDEGQKRLQVREREVLNKMIEDKAIEKIAKNRGLEISDGEVKEDIKERMESYGTGTAVVANLERLYGWSLKDFADKVVKPALYQQKLIAVYKEEANQKEAREKIELAEKELAAGTTFGEIAKKYSEGNTAETGGELGWFQLIDLAPELQDIVKGAPLNTPTVIQESSLGYHLILVHETKDEQGTTLYRLSQVFVKKTTFSEWLTSEMRKISVYVWSPFYKWNNETAEVNFSSESWQQYEQSVYENNTDDALFTN